MSQKSGQPFAEDEDDWLGWIVSRIDKVQLQKGIQFLGAGLLNKKMQTKKIDEQILYQLGRVLAARIKAKHQNYIQQLQQAERIRQLQTVRQLKLLRKLEPEEFEYWTAGYFEQFGFQDVTVTSFSGDFGVDVYMTCPNGKPAIVQCKRYKGQVGRPTVQQSYGVMKLLGAEVCYVVTTGRFTEEAIELGKRRDIVLLDGDFLVSGKLPT